MYLIVVGAGATASSLVSIAIKQGYRVAVIEKDAEKAQAILQKHDVQVLQADIAQGGILEEANADRADVLVAMTSDDSTNLMAIFLGKEHGIKNLVSMLNNSQHQAMFESLGARVVVDPEVIIAQQIFSFIDQSDAET